MSTVTNTIPRYAADLNQNQNITRALLARSSGRSNWTMDLTLHFGLDNHLGATNAYRLLELPADILKLIESSDPEAPRYALRSIKPKHRESAVFCV